MTARPAPRTSRLAGLTLAIVGMALVAAAAAYLAVRYVLWPRLDQFRPEIVALIGHQLGRPVSVEALHPGWDGVHPSLRIDGLRLDGPDGEARLAVASAFARVSWRSIALWRPHLGVLQLEAPVLTVERLAERRYAIAGFEFDADGPSDGGGLDWLLGQGEIAVAAASLRFVDRAAGLAPVTIEGLSIGIDNAGRRHRARVEVVRPADGVEAVAASVEFYRPPFARPSDWRRWQGELHGSGRGVQLRRIAELAAAFEILPPGTLAGAEGRIDLLAALRFDEARPLDATLNLRAERAQATLADGRLELDALRAEARIEPARDGGFDVHLKGLSATDARGFSLAADGEAELGLDDAGGLRRARLRLQAFDAEAALRAARRLPLPPAALRGLGQVGLRGDVRDLTLSWARAEAVPSDPQATAGTVAARGAATGAPRFELSASFDHLGLQLGEAPDGHRLPGFGNLSGSVRATDREGQLTLAGRNATLVFPEVFDEPTIPFERLEGGVSWTFDPQTQAVRVEVPRMSFANADLHGTAAGHWRNGGKGPGLVELTGRVERMDARRVPRYLPRKLPANAREWIERSVLAGTADDVRFTVRGDLYDFPFRDPAEGEFRIAATVRDATLAYAPQWPRIEQIDGDLLFERAGFEIRAKSGRVEGVRLVDVRARLPEYRDAVLTIEGRGAGPAQDMVRFVDASPLASTVSTFTRDLRIDGDARLGLKLSLPLSDPAATRIAGSVDFPGNEVSLDSTLPPLTGLSGRLEFDERGIALPELRATLLGGPIRVEARRAGDGRMHVEASGSIDAAGMRRLVDNPLTRRLDGRTDYRASVEVDRRASTLRIESDLVGLSSTLPAPFAKSAAETWPLRVQSRPLAPSGPAARPPGDRLDVRLRQDIAFALERERDPASQRLRVHRASFAVDAEPVLRDTGLSVLLRTRSIDLDAWRTVLGDGELERLEQQTRGSAAPGMSLVPDLVSVVADDVRIAGRDLHEVVVGASRAGGRWQANIASREIVGQFEWRDPRLGERVGTLTARFARLELPRSREGEVESALSASPDQLPGLDVTVDELVLGRLPMGTLSLSATNGGTAEQPVWRLDRLVVGNEAARLEAKGSWAFAGASGRAAPAGADLRRTSLDFDLNIVDAGRLLARMGLKDTMHGGGGSMSGTVHWHGSPLAIDYPSLDGDVTIALGKGEFLKVDPGMAKLVGVLNMQSLPKRLSGDFRDLFGEGFAFDSIGGQVKIAGGIARTGDLRTRGLQAQVTIRGEADLARETQRLTVEVVPELNAGLASLAFGAMVNPVIGLGTFAAQYVLRKPLQDVLAYDIDVTGSWSDPAVSERNRRLTPAPSTHTP